MKFTSTTLDGVWLIELEPHLDERGFFARTFCEREFTAHGLNTRWPQCNITRTLHRGTIRGLHWQDEPKPEIKLVRCVTGAIWDVVVDIQPGSSTFGRWESFELSADKHRQLYIPAGFAHGFQTLAENCEVHYQMSEGYESSLARGIRWNDPDLAIPWPVSSCSLSDRDQALPVLATLAARQGRHADKPRP